MAKISAMRSDPELVEGGRWVPWALGMELRLARWNNLRFQAEIRRLTLERAGPGMPDLTDEQQTAIVREAASRFILTDWRNVEDDEGNALPYTPALGLGHFLDPGHADFWTFVVTQSNKLEAYRAQHQESVLGNSSPASNGRSRGGRGKRR